MKHIGELLKEASLIKDDAERKEFLRKNETLPLKNVLKLVYDRNLEFRISKIPTTKFSEKPHPDYFWSNLIKEYRRLGILIKGNNKGIDDKKVEEVFFCIYDSLSSEEQKIVKYMVEKRSLPYKRLTKTFVLSVFPDIIDYM